MIGKKTHYCFLVIILILSAYIHLWNPLGFPDIFFDEGIYMRRAINVIETGNPQEAYFYDHPYFGQLVLAGFMKLAGFPDTVQQSLEASYLVPRILMGLFAVLDTFLIYKISEVRFGKKTAIISGVLFASMPITWMFRRILLDTILMPFLLSSILLALYSRNQHSALLIVSSSVLLGLAIFTKITAIVMIPVVAYIIASNHRFAGLIRWLPAVFLIPLAWPTVAIFLRQFDLWLEDVFWQAGRNNGNFLQITGLVFVIDPILVGLSFVGLGFVSLKRNIFLMLWIIPFLIFVNMIGFFQYFHYIMILPAMCVIIAYMLYTSIAMIRRINLQNYAYVGIVLAFAVYGTVISTDIISINLTESQFSTMQYTIDTFDDEQFTLLASPVYTWILSDIHGKDNVFLDYTDILFNEPKTDYKYLIVDPHFILDQSRGSQISESIQNTTSIQTFSTKLPDSHRFPYLDVTGESQHIDIRTNKANWP